MNKLILLKSIIILFSIISNYVAYSDVVAYKSEGEKKLFIESAPQLGKNTYLLKFEGFQSPWSNKVIKTLSRLEGKSTRYYFSYDLELSSGLEKRDYVIVVELLEKTLQSGSLVKQIELHFPGVDKNPPKLIYDDALSNKSQKIDLAHQYKLEPFRPEVD